MALVGKGAHAPIGNNHGSDETSRRARVEKALLGLPIAGDGFACPTFAPRFLAILSITRPRSGLGAGRDVGFPHMSTNRFR